MKKIIVICLSLFIFQNVLFSQNEFGTVGSYWRYSFEPHNGDGGGWTTIRIVKDTIINGDTYKQYKRQQYYKPMSSYAIETSSVGLLRIQNDSIFREDILFLDFDMQLSDSLYLEAAGGKENIQLAVDSITAEEIGGFEYKKWHGQKICFSGGNGPGPYEPFTILETVGQIERDFLFWNTDGCSIGGGFNYFQCYSNGEFTYPTGVDCAQLFLTSTNNLLRDAQIDVYPNPSHNILHVKLIESTIESVSVLALEGKEILYQDGKGNEAILDTSTLEQGMYLIKIKSKNGIAIQKFIKL